METTSNDGKITLSLSGCGSSGGDTIIGGTPANAPTNSTYVDVTSATDIADLSHSFEIPVHRKLWGTTQFAVDACNQTNTTRLRSTPIALPQSLSSAAIGYFKASKPGGEDTFFTVTLSGDSNTLAVGAHSEASNATGINGNQGNNSAILSGAVYLY